MKWLKFGQRVKARQQTLQLVSLLSRWCQVREDLIFAFEKCQSSGLEDPMQQAVADLLVRVRGGLPVDQALDLMQKSIEHENFRDLITAIRFNFRHRGDLPALLEQLETQLHRIEAEYERRRLSNARDFGLTLLILLLVPLMILGRLLINPSLGIMFLANPIGIALLPVSFLTYLSAWIYILFIQRRITG